MSRDEGRDAGPVPAAPGPEPEPDEARAEDPSPANRSAGAQPHGVDSATPSSLPSQAPGPGGADEHISEADVCELVARDLLRALYSEFGAYSMYTLLPRWTRNRELLALLRAMAEDERRLIPDLQALIAELGQRPRQSRLSRSVAAWGLWLATPIAGMPFALRLCQEAESTVSRWYAQNTVVLYRLGRQSQAERTRGFSQQKHIHAVRLSAFIGHLRRGE